MFITSTACVSVSPNIDPVFLPPATISDDPVVSAMVLERLVGISRKSSLQLRSMPMFTNEGVQFVGVVKKVPTTRNGSQLVVYNCQGVGLSLQGWAGETGPLIRFHIVGSYLVIATLL